MQADPTQIKALGETAVHPIALLMVGVAVLLTLVLPRRYVIIPFLMVAFFIPFSQRVMVGPLHFFLSRVALIFVWIRMIFSGTWPGGAARWRLSYIDKAFIFWALSEVTIYVLRWQTSDALINRLGFFYDAFGIYFSLRFMCRDSEDVNRMIRVLAVLAAIVGACMVTEQITGRNLFSVFGGVPDITPIRDGNLRSQGAFQHSILAGCFGATLLPLFVSLWWQRGRSAILAAVGVVSATVITITSSSSTPTGAYIAGIVALFMWPFRKVMRLVRWGIVVSLVSLHLVMKAPVWALIARISLVGGSSGWHRFELIDQFIGRFGEWWLLGTSNNASWGLDTWDVANQYVAQGVTGGLLTFVLFLILITRCFTSLGMAREMVEGDAIVERRLWALGAALFANLVAFFGIAYFDQTVVVWYALLAMISAASIPVIESARTNIKPAAAPAAIGVPLPATGQVELPALDVHARSR